MARGRKASPIHGRRIGCYTVIARVTPRPQETQSRWRVTCDCGLTKVVFGNNLLKDFPLKCNHVPEGYRVVGPSEWAVLEACKSVPDETLGDDAASPGKHWEPVRNAVRELKGIF